MALNSKQVRRDIVERANHDDDGGKASAEGLWTGMVDLAVETNFLRNLNHANIIKLRGVAKGADDDHIFAPDHFIVLDRLYDTLLTRIHQRWKRRLDREARGSSPSRRNKSTSLSSIRFLRQCLSVALHCLSS